MSSSYWFVDQFYGVLEFTQVDINTVYMHILRATCVIFVLWTDSAIGGVEQSWDDAATAGGEASKAQNSAPGGERKSREVQAGDLTIDTLPDNMTHLVVSV